MNVMCVFVAVVKAEMVDTTRDVVFPSQPDQLGNFSMKMNENVHITLPADSLIRLASGDSKTGG